VIERRIRILEDELHVPPRLAQVPSREAEHILTAKDHRAGRWFDEA
jgi:hypothetical protein